ncbi:hypothetical protein Hanom_Chr16g01464331 [Helianthus anomalus]
MLPPSSPNSLVFSVLGLYVSLSVCICLLEVECGQGRFLIEVWQGHGPDKFFGRSANFPHFDPNFLEVIARIVPVVFLFFIFSSQLFKITCSLCGLIIGYSDTLYIGLVLILSVKCV